MLKVSIPNWAKFNPRADRVNYSWLRFENKFFHDQKVFKLTDSERVLYIFLLCEASQANSGELEILPDYIGALLGHTPSQVIANIQKLNSCGLVTADCRHHDGIMTAECRQSDGTTTAYVTRRDETRHDDTGPEELTPKLKPKREARDAGLTIPTWEAYRDGYQRRYGVAPIRNTTVNGKLAHFVRRLGASEAPLVAEFYLAHNSARYLQAGHSVGLMLQDAEKLRTEWATGTQITQAQVRQVEQAGHNAQVAADYLARKHGGAL